MSLSIVIPFYKISLFEKTLASLALQTDKRFRVFVGDDAAPVSAQSLVEDFKNKIDISYHRFDENVGGKSLTRQWDRCIAMAPESDWVMLLGDDDFLDDNVIASFYQALPDLGEETSVIRFASRMVQLPENTIGQTFTHPQYEAAASAYARRLRGETRSTMSEYIFRKTAYQSFGFRAFPLAWHSDDAAWIEFSNGSSIFSINDAVVNITISPESISGNSAGLLQKRQATAQFYEQVVLPKINMFSGIDRLLVLYAAEVAIKNCRPLTAVEWKALFVGYYKLGKVVPFFRFLRRYLVA